MTPFFASFCRGPLPNPRTQTSITQIPKTHSSTSTTLQTDSQSQSTHKPDFPTQTRAHTHGPMDPPPGPTGRPPGNPLTAPRSENSKSRIVQSGGGVQAEGYRKRKHTLEVQTQRFKPGENPGYTPSKPLGVFMVHKFGLFSAKIGYRSYNCFSDAHRPPGPAGRPRGSPRGCWPGTAPGTCTRSVASSRTPPRGAASAHCSEGPSVRLCHLFHVQKPIVDYMNIPNVCFPVAKIDD